MWKIGLVLITAAVSFASTAYFESVASESGEPGCSVAPTSDESNSSQERRKENHSEQLSLYSVPLGCPAAPQIGCGSRTKPILLDLETKPEVAGAWLNRRGTTLAVAWKSEVSTTKRAEIATAAFKQNEVNVEEVSGESRTNALKEFYSDIPWYSASGVDLLSEEEASIIAARVVRRMTENVSVPAETADKLKTVIAGMLRKKFTGEGMPNPSEIENELLQEADTFLDKESLAAFKAAMDQGYRPLNGES